MVAGRVSEVTARFTLDAMPGKQMAIDSDLNAGFDHGSGCPQTTKRSAAEADFFGSMDGASKFVKGDAIAGILITVINLVGGAIIFLHGGQMTVMEAFAQFGKLAIGDGLVGSIPSLLISIASGVIVTRSDNDSSFGLDIAADVMRNPQLFRIVGAILFVLALVPGFPFVPFVLIGLGLFAASFLVTQKKKSSEWNKTMGTKLALERKSAGKKMIPWLLSKWNQSQWKSVMV